MGKRWHKKTDKLKDSIISLGEDVEGRVSRSLEAVFKKDIDLAKQIIATDSEIDEKEVQLEEECIKILALNQPVAGDLRFVVAVLKINNDLERIADLAKNIAERAIGISEIPVQDEFPEIPVMAEITKSMLRLALNSLQTLDVSEAHKVLKEDDKVDEIHRGMYEKVSEHVLQQPKLSPEFFQVLSLSRYLERIADLTSNISEDVIYFIDGEIIRHQD